MNTIIDKFNSFMDDYIDGKCTRIHILTVLYPEEYEATMQLLENAFFKSASDSVLLLARNKQTLHSFISKICIEVQKKLELKQAGSKLKIIRINTIQTKSEAGMLGKLCDSLGMHQAKRSFYSVEMIEEVKAYFESNKDVSVLFVMEDIDYYVD